MRFDEIRKEEARVSWFVEGYRGEAEDRVNVLHGTLSRGEEKDSFLIGVADGVGGQPGGAEAAERMVSDLDRLVEEGEEWMKYSPEDWEGWLLSMDRSVKDTHGAGMTTCVVAAVSRQRICGASAGDSECWLVGEDRVRTPTKNQLRRPFPGSGQVNPVSFNWSHSADRVLIATDGLWKYAPREKLLEVVRGEGSTAREVAECVRLPGGNLQDDVGVVLVQFFR